MPPKNYKTEYENALKIKELTGRYYAKVYLTNRLSFIVIVILDWLNWNGKNFNSNQTDGLICSSIFGDYAFPIFSKAYTYITDTESDFAMRYYYLPVYDTFRRHENKYICKSIFVLGRFEFLLCYFELSRQPYDHTL